MISTFTSTTWMCCYKILTVFNKTASFEARALIGCGAGCNVDRFDSTVYIIFFLLFLAYVLNVTRADNPEAVYYPAPLKDDDFWVHSTVDIIWILESLKSILFHDVVL